MTKGRQEYQETLNCWKQVDHVMGILLLPRGRPQRTFLQKFYEGACPLLLAHNFPNFDATGRDEDAVLPAASGIL